MNQDRPSRCAIGDCPKVPAKLLGGVAMCAMHVKRLQRLRHGTSRRALSAATPEDLAPFERVIVTGNTYLEASAEDDAAYHRALESFQRACRAWLRSCGWTPPAALEDAGDEGEVR